MASRGHGRRDAAARDVQTGTYPLTNTAPVRKTDYLGGRFLAGFRTRLQVAQRRFTSRKAWSAAAAVALILTLGSVIV